jgi:N-acetylneuraminate synthase
MQKKISSITIGNKKIGPGEPCFIIAEAGVNHNGDPALAKKLIDIASEAKADAVKFQTFKAEHLVTRDADKAEYQKTNTESDESQYDMLKRLEFSDENYQELFSYAKKRGILFLSTPFDPDSADLLDRIGVLAFKISSGDLTNLLLLSHIVTKNKPVILSTGMSCFGEIEVTVNHLKKKGLRDLVLLHCTTSYPAPLETVNLRVMKNLRNAFGFPVGYSDHTTGINIASAAVALGACIIEKHFTLDRSLPGPDHKTSLEPSELKAMVRNIRELEIALGDGIKVISSEECDIKKIATKSLVAKCTLYAGDTISDQSIVVKRPGTGIEPKYFDLVLGKKAKQDIKKDRVITWDMIE